MSDEEEYEVLRQQLQTNLSQKQTLQLQYNELKRTVDEVEKSGETDELFEMVGQILIKKNKKDILNKLKDKLDIYEFRLKNLEKSIDEDTKKLQELQKKLERL